MAVEVLEIELESYFGGQALRNLVALDAHGLLSHNVIESGEDCTYFTFIHS